MKTLLKSFVFVQLLLMSGFIAEAQLIKKIKDRVKQTAEDKVVNKAGEMTEEGMNNAEDRLKNDKNNKRSDDNASDAKQQTAGDNKSIDNQQAGKSASLTAYSNYDFVPGEKIIYYYDMAGEADAEIPGRMLINSGSTEIQTYKGEKVLLIPQGEEVVMKPLMNEQRYLPEQFTFEFDLLANGGIGTSLDVSEVTVSFREAEKSESDATAPLFAGLTGASGDETYGHFRLESYNEANDNWSGISDRAFPVNARNATQNNWRHVAIYVNKSIGKLYIDQHRLGIVNQLIPGKADKILIEVKSQEHPVLLRNFRLAAGGADAYKKVITEGKFIAYGIQFDVNKSVLKPESMGTINEFVKMMKSNPDLKFEIGGHTDSDGMADRNNQLSLDRANAVKKQMVSMGVDAARLTTKGYGSLNPVTENNSAENKARNRRVEFIKK